jgi:UDP-2,4-diacetamido-2,4,6-trideoxy-beta-L-altropyranose hydrolase
MTKICFRLDCSEEIGFGHLSRARTILELLKPKIADLYIFGTKNLDKALCSGFNQIYFLDESQLMDQNFSDQYDLGIFDFSTKFTMSQESSWNNYFEKVKRYCQATFLIDGLGNDSILIKNSTLDLDYALIPYVGAPHLENHSFIYWQGPQYFLFSQEINKIHLNLPQEKVSQLLVTMGGSDPMEMTIDVMNIIGSKFKTDVVIGPYFTSSLIEKIKNKANQMPLMNLVDGKKGLHPYLLGKDLCFTASGLTKYELAKVGLPSVIISHNESADLNNREFMKLGTGLDLGVYLHSKIDHAQVKFFDLCQSWSRRKEMYFNAQKIFNSNKVIEIFQQMGVVNEK